MINLPYRLGVGLMILNDKAEAFVGKRIDTRTASWQMPQGGIDHGESVEQAVFREMQEEIGNNFGKIIAQTKQWYSYDIPEYLIPRLWDGQYKGQKQKWFLIKYEGNDQDINIQSNENPEFLEWKWIQLQELPEVIVSFKRDLYISVIEEFRDEILEIKSKCKAIK